MQETVKAFELPQALKTELSGISTQVGLEILGWAKYYGQYYCESAFFNNACWTPQGAIDAEKTARKLVNDESLSILKRYEVACIHCFEDMIPDLWKQWGKEERHLKRMRKSRMYDRLAIFWSYYIHGQAGEIIKDSSINEYGLNIAVEQGNGVAVRYFWEKLIPIEKERNLEKCIVTAAKESCHYVSGSRNFPNSCYTDIVCFLLNQVGEEQQVEAFTYNIEVTTFSGKRDSELGSSIFKGLLNFPYQEFFIPTAERLWHSLHERECYSLLYYTAEKVHHYPEIYRKILKYIWQKILDQKLPMNMQKVEGVLSEVCKIGDNESVELILNRFSPSEKEAFIFSYDGIGICYVSADNSKWNTLELLFKRCLVNKNTALKFKEKENISSHFLWEKLPDKAEKFTKLLDDFITSFKQELPIQTKGESNKRKVEDDDLPLKRIKTDSKINHVNVSNVMDVRQVC